MGDMVLSVLIICILHRIWAIRFFVANMLPWLFEKSGGESSPLLVSADFSPHKIRHSTAMALMEEGTELIIVRDLLGHVSVQTTEIYAKASTARKRKAIEAHGMGLVEEEVPLWESNRSVLEWLIGMKKRNIM